MTVWADTETQLKALMITVNVKMETKLEHVKQWLNLFVYLYNRSIRA